MVNTNKHATSSLAVSQLCDAGKRTHFIFGKTTPIRKPNTPPAKKKRLRSLILKSSSQLQILKTTVSSEVFLVIIQSLGHSLPPKTYAAVLVLNLNLPREGTDEITANMTD